MQQTKKAPPVQSRRIKPLAGWTLSKITIGIAVAATTFLTVSQVHAHGGKPHDEKAKPATVVQEQMPWGIAGHKDKVTRTVEVSMFDQMRFEPANLQVQANETIRFVVKNQGQIMHEFVLGTLESNAEHAELMKKFPNMEHDAPYMAHVEPGQNTEIVWQFNRSGQFEFACLIAGHYDAGMRGPVKVGN